jgi:hypothetical protein
MAWQDLYEATGDSCFRQWYLAARDRALASHRCFIPGHHDPERVMDRLHAYAYFLEGLLPCAGERDVAAAMREGVGTLARYLNEISPCFARSDVYAQLLRLRIYAEWLGVLAVDHAAARHEAEQLAAFQLSDADPRIEGGFAFGRRQGQLMPYVNPVSAGFGLQALALWRDYCAGMRQAHRHLLI